MAASLQKIIPKQVKQHGFWLWANWQPQPGQLGGEGDGQHHEVLDFFCQSVQNKKGQELSENHETSPAL